LASGLILDASAALAWLIERKDPVEANLALEILSYLRNRDAVVPALWFPEVANGILVAERRVGVDAAKSASFLAIVDQVKITEDSTRSFALQGTVLDLARTYGLTAYDATYLELALRTKSPLATFDRQLAEAVRKAGGQVFGDTGN
jgi:predicted nucleic acid-binding protein